MALAVRMLGDHRREWALAMRAEFEVASEDGNSLTFALGCLIAACRELPAHEKGRFALVSHLLVLAVIVPLAALMISTVLIGFPASYLGHFGIPGLLEISSEQGPLLSEANRSAVPSLAVAVLMLAALDLRIAWLTLDRDWARLSAVGFLSAAATAALLIFSAVVFVDPAAALAHVAVLAVELSAASALARWHSRLSSTPSRTLIR